MNKENKNDQDLPEIVEEKKKNMEWVKSHKKQLILIGISIPTLIAIMIGLKNKDAMIELMNNLKKEVKEASRYSDKWIRKATDAELNEEREKVRLAYCASGDNFKAACSLQNLLGIFDRELDKRAWGNRVPQAPSFHREHGWYLPNDD